MQTWKTFKNVKINASGFSLAEVMVAVGIVGILAMGLLTLSQQSLKQQTQSNVTFQADNLRRNMRLTINSGVKGTGGVTAWQNTVNNVANPNLTCLNTGGDCSPYAAPAGAPQSIYIINDANNNVAYDLSTGKGFRSDGQACSGFNLPPATGNDSCPLSYTLQWTAICQGSGHCSGSNVQIMLQLTAIYNPQSKMKDISFNANNYSARFIQGLDNADCWTLDSTGTIVYSLCTVGIGTTAPLAPLNVVSSNTPQVLVQNAKMNQNNGQPFASIGFGDVTGTFGLISLMPDGGSDDDVSDMAFYTSYSPNAGGTGNNVEKMRILYNGNVGIGATAPTTQLANNNFNTMDTANIGQGTGAINWAQSSPGYVEELFNSYAQGNGLLVKGAGSSAAYPLLSVDYGTAQGTAGTAILRVLGNGNVGINNANPVATLDIGGLNSTNGSNYLHVAGSTNPNVANQGSYLSWNKTNGNGETDFINNMGGGSGGFQFFNTKTAAAGNAVMVLTGAGRLGLATSAPDAAVSTSPLTTGGPSAHFGNGSSALSALVANAGDVQADGNLYVGGAISAPGGITSGTISVNGNLQATGTITGSSDVRLKKEITPIKNALAKILSLKGIYYFWKDKARGTARMLGFTAQNVEQEFPEAVVTGSDGYKSVAYGNLAAPLVEAIREQQKQIDALVEKNKSLELQIKKLQDK